MLNFFYLWQVEAALASCDYVDSIMVHADPFHSYCVALVVPPQKLLEKWAQQAGIEYKDFPELCNKPEAVKEVLQSISKVSLATCFLVIEDITYRLFNYHLSFYRQSKFFCKFPHYVIHALYKYLRKK